MTYGISYTFNHEWRKGVDKRIIIGATVGGVVFVALVVGGVILFMRRRKTGYQR